ncbi:lycopene cyclase family protein [Nocardiopsis sp. YSL2]|uniref:lycopene cyclase family protein n=1 Tax=Nocardiopsis sp. YSL2 TaxID=2939492 RepID=UPI0026F46389|nr:lycopene cyclase family protein [Nocardiopsis sp. YSL2]
MTDFDVAIIGGGAAGLTLAHLVGRVNERRGVPLDTVLIEAPPGPHTPPPRTWCFWERDGGPWDGLLSARWEDLSVVGGDGTTMTSSAAPYVYKMLRSTDVEEYVRAHAGAHVDQRSLFVTALADGPEHATVTASAPDGTREVLTARWVFDSRPPPRPLPARTSLLQHFRGWFVRTPDDAFDPAAAVLMDLRTPQPPLGVSFGYVLPLTRRTALVEYTEFGRTPLTTPAYERALADYCERVGLGGVEVTAAEQGVIPMTDARMPTRAGRRLFRVGTAGGATRPATGYTFSGVGRQARAVADALAAGRVPVPPVPHRPRHLAMDAVMLRALDTGRVRGADFFTRLFARNRLGEVLAFLDGDSPLRRELVMGLTTPVGAMSLTTAEHAWHALLGRPGALRRG